MSPPEVCFVTSLEALDALQPAWQRCLERSVSASVFVSFEWQRAWWAHYAAGHPLRVAVASEDGQVTGILPLYVGTAPLVPGFRARVLRLVGSGADTSPDYLGPVLDESHGPATLAALCRAVACSPGWDAMDLTDVAESSPFLAEMERACRDAGIAAARLPGWRISIVRLPPSWDEYLATLSRDRRNSVRRMRRRIEEAGGRFFTWAGDPSLDVVIDRLVELHHQRWRGRADKYAFSTPEYVGFHRDVMRACAERGRLRLYCLELQGAIAAVYYCYAFNGEVAYFQGGFDPRHEKLRPGYTLMAYALEQAIAEGARVFDMLKGEYAHKAIWTSDSRATESLRAYRTSPRGRLLHFRREQLARWKAGRTTPAAAAPAQEVEP